MITIVDSGGGNLGSIQNAFDRLGLATEVSADPDRIHRAAKVILPGVGAAGRVMDRLHERELVDCVRNLRQPVLGICLGMQLLYRSSEENNVETLGILSDRVRALPKLPGFVVPHLGWNSVGWVAGTRKPCILARGIESGSYFYFVHSYAAGITNDTVGVTDHGIPFSAVIERGNFFGTQFHPERSGATGARLLRNFAEISG